MPTMEEKAAEARGTAPTFETLLQGVGPFGLYQKVMCVALIGGSTLVCALTYYTQVLLMLTPPATCNDPQPGPGYRPPQLMADGVSSANVTSNDTGSVFSGGDSNSSSRVVGGSTGGARCGNWSYDTGVMFHTIASENDWVGDEAWRPFIVHAVFWAGNIVGSWVWGIISDKLGRRPATIASFVVYAAGGALTLVRPSSMEVIMVVRFLVGSAHHTVTHLPYVLVIEYCGSAYRTYPLLALIAAWGLGGVLLPWIAFFAWNWRLLVCVSSMPLLIAVLFYRYIPESASWLMVNGRGDEAEAVLRRVAAANGCELDEAVFCEVMVDKREGEPQTGGESLLHVWRHQRLMKNMAFVTILWMLACLCFYGHSQNTGNLGRSVFVSFSLGGAVELAALVVPLVIHRLGRRWPMATFFVTSGLCGVLYAMIGSGLSSAGRLALGLTGRMLIMGAYSTCLQYGPELFPTVIRGQSLALYETLGGLAIFISPSIVYLHHQTPGLPLLV
ncbi:organic cation transporter protein-like, partial [Pollicipes pollicipes]|uniref:organic cation transporter protein-like n=1 Tax=Pollicipes pollicipes TaxID=41117 RepID=UPI00188518EC